MRPGWNHFASRAQHTKTAFPGRRRLRPISTNRHADIADGRQVVLCRESPVGYRINVGLALARLARRALFLLLSS